MMMIEMMLKVFVFPWLLCNVALHIALALVIDLVIGQVIGGLTTFTILAGRSCRRLFISCQRMSSSILDTKLEELGIPLVFTKEHDAVSSDVDTFSADSSSDHQVMTVDEMIVHLEGVKGERAKNLFLKDKKKVVIVGDWCGIVNIFSALLFAHS